MADNRFRVNLTVYLILRKGDEVLLLERQNTGYQDGFFSVAAGHVDGGEVAEQAVVREAKEEVGIDINPSDLRLVYVVHRLNDRPENEYLSLFFECRTWQGTPQNNEPDKCSRIEWTTMAQLPDNIIDGVAEVLATYEAGKNYKSYS